MRLYWFWPERMRLQEMQADEAVWRSYRIAAQSAGLTLDIISVDDVDVLARPDEQRVYVRGEPVDPTQAFFHNKLYTWPMFQPDVWRSLATFQAVAEAGYCTVQRPELNLISNDKAATLLHLRTVDPQWLPTLSLPTREFGGLRVRLRDAGISFPVVVKPASWGSGKGVIRADDEAHLVMALRLAGAAELGMVIQPYVDLADLADVRVYCVDGEPVGVLYRTVDAGTVGTVANVTSGGAARLAPVPEVLHERAAAIAERLDTPWLGVDFLGGDDGFYLSEVEIDACVGPVTSLLPGMDVILHRRFAAYRRRFERWRSGAARSCGTSVPAPLR